MSTLQDRLAARRRFSLAFHLWATLREWRHRVRSRDTLARLSDHELRDIGISPAERREECLKPFWQG
jgi:uncharacterized protein YjiS (DUF1127 family)